MYVSTTDQVLEKNGSTVRENINYSETSRKAMIQLGGKHCTMVKTVKVNICLIIFPSTVV
jgi:hypothetical protein